MDIFGKYMKFIEKTKLLYTYLIFWRLNMDQEMVATKTNHPASWISTEAMAHKKFDDLPLI